MQVMWPCWKGTYVDVGGIDVVWTLNSFDHAQFNTGKSSREREREREREKWALIRNTWTNEGVGDHSHGEMLANLFFDLFLLADVAGTLSSLGRDCVSVRRERDVVMLYN